MVCEQSVRPRLRARGGDGASTRDGFGWIGFRRAGIAVSLDREDGAVACVRGQRDCAAAKGDGVLGYLIKCPVQENGKGRKAGEAFASIVFHNPP